MTRACHIAVRAATGEVFSEKEIDDFLDRLAERAKRAKKDAPGLSACTASRRTTTAGATPAGRSPRPSWPTCGRSWAEQDMTPSWISSCSTFIGKPPPDGAERSDCGSGT